MVSGEGSSGGSGAMPLALGLGGAVTVAYVVVWEALKKGGCGPPRNTSSGQIFAVAPFVLPAVAVVIVLLLGVGAKWRLRVLLTALVTTIVAAGLGEVVVFLFEFGTHHCGD
jgi:hypothetical protein